MIGKLLGIALERVVVGGGLGGAGKIVGAGYVGPVRVYITAV